MIRHHLSLTLACLTALTLFLAPPAALANEESVCLQCHANLERQLSEPVALWRESIHAANGISCHNCHGGNPSDFGLAMAPESGFIGAPDSTEIPDFCGRCHIGVRDDYLASAHGQARLEGGPHCVNCHSNHRVAAASLDLIDPQLCSNCHRYERAERLKKALTKTESSMTGLEQELADLFRLGVVVRDKQDALFAVRNDYRRLAHSVDVEQVEAETTKFAERIDAIQGDIDATHTELTQRKVIGAVIVALLLLTGGVALLIRRSYEEEESKR
mgnify:CR=1 FL=1